VHARRRGGGHLTAAADLAPLITTTRDEGEALRQTPPR